ncbi:MAG: flavodoxin family protein [Oscillospiraceae bacterium]|jgi:multimeric flavodoxin WrbA|nr:flavodoxin family protein [Oscillospiraceae bacterium]
MKVFLLNGSPHPEGCTFTALSEVAAVLSRNGAETEIYQLGTSPVRGCVACHRCHSIGKCAFGDDAANEIIEKIKAADGVVLGSPVYYAGPNGALCAVLDRVFFAAARDFAYKPGAAVVSCRRGGASASFDRLNKYFTISHMPVVPSQYWNAVHGATPDDVRRDKEGLQIMRALGANMAWLLKSIAAGEGPIRLDERREMTSFIRPDNA